MPENFDLRSALPQIADRRRKIEIAAVLATAAGKFLFMDMLEWRLPFILVTITAWTIYVVSQAPASARHSSLLGLPVG